MQSEASHRKNFNSKSPKKLTMTDVSNTKPSFYITNNTWNKETFKLKWFLRNKSNSRERKTKETFMNRIKSPYYIKECDTRKKMSPMKYKSNRSLSFCDKSGSYFFPMMTGNKGKLVTFRESSLEN